MKEESGQDVAEYAAMMAMLLGLLLVITAIGNHAYYIFHYVASLLIS